MFNTLSIAQLEKLLNQFSVPMFAIENQEPGSDFRITCANTALEELSGRSLQDLLGRSIREIAAETSAKDAIEYYRRCVTTRETIRFAFLFGDDRNGMRWNKTLQYARSPEGYDRVIATAIRVPDEKPLLEDKLAFEDVRYFSSIADLQLENLSSAFSAASKQARVTPIDEDRIMRLHAVCRTIQSTVSDIKQVVRAAQERHGTASARISGADQVRINQRIEDAEFSTVRVLTSDCAKGTAHHLQ